MEDKGTWRAVLLPRGKLQRISLGQDFLGCRRGGLAIIGRAAAGSPGTLLVACTAEMWLEILDRTAEN